MNGFVLSLCIYLIVASVISAVCVKKELRGYIMFACTVFAVCFTVSEISEINISFPEYESETQTVEGLTYIDSVLAVTRSMIENDIKEKSGAKAVTVRLSEEFEIESVELLGVENREDAVMCIETEYGIEGNLIRFD